MPGKYNPFRPDKIVPPGMFSGRIDELRFLDHCLLQTKNGNAQHFLVEGERGIGKPAGDGNMYGRDGILAHSYLLGDGGASNGCISVRDYSRFLKAYEDGKFNQIIVLRSADEPVPSQVASAQA